ncbi:putative phage tail assembly chaperone [Orbus wheelerorum]|uniref:putative phage tail assembly chaperone n=1 Tax=Orbus wheelerorum TaxID=3074111 RepID=UPI00370DAC83
MKTKQIILTIAGNELTFNVTTLAYNSYVNEITQQNKIAPSIQFVNRTVNKDDSEKLKTLLNDYPGAALQIAGKLIEDFAPDLEITIKN